MKIIASLILMIAFLSGCASSHDPEVQKRINELENKTDLDEFDKMELQDLRQHNYKSNPLDDTCKI